MGVLFSSGGFQNSCQAFSLRLARALRSARSTPRRWPAIDPSARARLTIASSAAHLDHVTAEEHRQALAQASYACAPDGFPGVPTRRLALVVLG
jgi:hypothetical protein